MMHVSIKKTSILSALALCACVLALPFIASAQEFVTLSGIPGLESASGNKISMQGYLDNLYRIAIIAAALIAVIKLILAGAQYVLSGVVTDKEHAKKDIKSALVGLLIILAATTLLTTINPSLTNLKALQQAPAITSDYVPPKSPEQIFCESPDGCTKKSCDKASGWGYLNAYNIVGELGCEIGCREWYGGEVVDDICIYPKNIDTSTENYVDYVASKESMCDENGCEAIKCPFWRTEFTCSGWCENQGGVFIDTGVLTTTNTCVVPKTD